MKKISIVSPCYNESENIPELYCRISAVMSGFPAYDYEIILADNCSTDGTREVIREIAAKDRRLKAIFNAANFGHIRSPYNAFLAARGDAVVLLCSDLQEPPECIADFIRAWESGAKVVCGVKPKSKENPVMFFLRRMYYKLIRAFSDTPQIENFTGFGLYDRRVVEELRRFHEPYPYLRGLVAEVGFARVEVKYEQQRRLRGKTQNNFFTLYDMAMTGFVNHTKMPLRLAAFAGFGLAGVSLVVAVAYLVYKLVHWNDFALGLAPLVIGLFFFASVQLIFIGVIGEYIGAIWTQVKNRPLVVEAERINFED